jgi:kynureninase
MMMEFTKSWAVSQDEMDPLRFFRKRFHFPQHDGKDCIYFTGNSLGLQPKTTSAYIQQELNDWASYGFEGHFMAKNPWFSYHEIFSEGTANLVGAKKEEVIVMNQLTSNLHFLMVSFYKPNAKRYKIICEAKAFPSDQYAIESQIKFHGFDPSDAMIEISPREGEDNLRTEDVLKSIEIHKDELALVLIGGVNYLTGQVFEIEKITNAAHKSGAYCGWDLAHATGNIKLNLHDWNVDFGCWCSYKYLNSGPGSVAGAFVHEKHLSNTDLPLFAGWWGHDKDERFKMERAFKPMKTAERWQVSNAPVLSMAAYKASLEIFNEAGIDRLVEKSKLLTSYLDFVIETINQSQPKENCFEIITPKTNRGCQLSVVAHGRGKELYQQLIKHGVIVDWREPNVIRMAPVPLYNTFEDIYFFGEVLNGILRDSSQNI